ncbi:MAG TPA: serine acetyltransferase, partial [Rikenellaceae bacterium]|nr:serine acetyltransferase [Rikenellaceae bacterium]
MWKFKDLYSADIARYGENLDAYTRVFHYLYRKASTTSLVPVRLFYKVFFRLWASRRGLEIAVNQQIGGGLYIGHAYNITINSRARIGRNCNIHKGIVIGQANRGAKRGTPIIGNRVWIGINAAIVGKVTIGDDVLIAPNSFVNVDVPSHSVVFGNPCVIKHRDHATEGYVNK